MSDQQSDPIQVAAQLGGTTNPTVEEVAHSEAFEPEPEADVTDAQADRAEILDEGEQSADVPGPDAGGEPVLDSP